MNFTKLLESAASVFHGRYTAWFVLSVSILLTILAFILSKNYSKQIADERFDARTHDIADAIQFRMTFYEQSLRGGVGLFNSLGEVDRTTFYEYVKSLEIQEHLPGLQGIGYCIPIKKADLENHIQSIRKEGFPDYIVKPQTEREEYSANIYLEPFDWRNKRAFGYDMWSNKIRREAMMRARDSGKAAVSGIITLVQETDKDIQKGFLMYLPVYEGKPKTVQQRKDSFKGWVYSPFRVGNFMKGVLGTVGVKEYDFEIYDGSRLNKKSLLFDSNNVPLDKENFKPQRTKIVTLDLQGRKWTILFHSIPNMYSENEELLPWIIGIAGLIVDIILFLVIYSLILLQKKARKSAMDLSKQTKQLITVNEELERFAYITSHDLQEPLRTINNYSNLLEEEYSHKLDEEALGFLHRIIHASKRMRELIQAILDYARIGHIDGLSEVRCGKVIENIEQDMESLIKEKRVTVKYRNLPDIKANETMIKQVFSNLIVNAVKYSKPDIDPIIEISAQTDEKYYYFFVKDNGVGIEEKNLIKIFHIFQRLNNDRSGIGIGLTVCKKIVQLHGGDINVESKIGEGSTFIFTIKKDLKL